MTLHEFRISWGTFDHGDRGEQRLSYDCMKSYIVRAQCKRRLKRMLAEGAPATVYFVRFYNQSLGISDTISGYDGKITRDWDQK